MSKKLPGTRRWMSLWRHFFDREKTVEQLTGSMIRWQEKWRWDFLKLNPPACYHVLDWGARYQFFDDPAMEPKLIEPAIISVEDVNRIRVLDPVKGVLGEQLQVIQNLRSHFGSDLPIVETVFSPIEIAHRLMKGRDSLSELRKQSPQGLHRLLEIITQVFSNFAEACISAGADGIFFATKWATRDQMTWNEYVDFGRRYEMRILERLKDKQALVILHVCGDRTFLPEMLDYPADIISYDFSADEAPDPAQIARVTGRHVLGGIDPAKLCKDVQSAITDCQKWVWEKWWLAGPSCVVMPETPDDAIRAIAHSLKE